MGYTGLIIIRNQLIIYIDDDTLDLLQVSNGSPVGKLITSIIPKLEFERLKKNEGWPMEVYFSSQANQINLEAIYESTSDENTHILKLQSAKRMNNEIYNFVSSFTTIGITERDFSQVFNTLQKLASDGVTDLRRYLLNHPDLVHQIHQSVKILHANKEMARILELNSENEVIEFLSSRRLQDLDSYIDLILKLWNNQGLENTQTVLETSRGEIRHVVIMSKYSGQDISRFMDLILDITELKQKEKEIQLSELKFKTFFEHIPVPLVLSKNRIIVDCNIEYTRLMGGTKSEIIGLHEDLSIAPAERDRIRKITEQRFDGIEVPDLYITKGQKLNGQQFPIEVRSLLIDVGGETLSMTIITNLTEKIEMEEEKERIYQKMASSHKLESLGLLSGGIAHDFNNMLQIIKSGLGIIQEADAVIDGYDDLLSDVLLTTGRAADLVKQLLLYTGRVAVNPEVLDLISLIQENMPMLRLAIPENILIEGKFSHIELYVKIDRTQIIQVLLNLVINAAEAIGDNNGEISLEVNDYLVTSVFNQNPNVFTNSEIIEGNYASITIRDSGHGITQEKILRIFDPFFSEKPGARGLGLSVVQGIIFSAGGFIEVNSILNKFTSIRIFLPQVEGDKKETIPINVISNDKNYQGKSVLIIEDEPDIRKILVMILSKMDFEVFEAANGKLGLDQLKKMGKVDLIILDLYMPVLSGAETFKQLKLKQPDIPIIISTGYSESSLVQFMQYDNVLILSKPYRSSDLRKIISKLL
ncbi:MAG: response regulator [Candidatus Heimdallarchaeota archaeon]|nr:response regulator [Candidatus Heimdallarchaeota archaeon]